jgi:hypothetical protein
MFGDPVTEGPEHGHRRSGDLFAKKVGFAERLLKIGPLTEELP